jgi:orotate phosphoribosyltransferase
MQQYKENFIRFLVKSGALKFGDFTLKSGRKCPYFLNMGSFNKGSLISELGQYYAEALNGNIQDYDIVFGPAYKGIPLAVATAAQTFGLFKKDAGFSYNRKEAKDHGEGGLIVGAPMTADSKVVVVDDVMTAGTAVRETFELLAKSGNPKVVGVLIAVDRMERGQGPSARREGEASGFAGAERTNKSAIQEVKEQFGVQVYSIVTIEEIIECLGAEIDPANMARIKEYRREYGVS